VAIVERSNTNNGAVIVKVNGLASNGGNGASDANKLVRFTSTGGISQTGGTMTDTTYAGSAAFTSTTRPTSAGTGTPGATSLITRADFDDRQFLSILSGYFEFSRTTNDWTSPVVTGSASAQHISHSYILYAGGTGATGTILSRYTATVNTVGYWNQSNGTNRQVDWSKRTALMARISVSNIATDGIIASCVIGRSFNDGSLTAMFATDRAIGWYATAGLLRVIVANGTTLTDVSTGVSITGSPNSWDIIVDSLGNGNWRCLVNGSQVASGTGAPTGLGVSGQNGAHLILQNNTATTLRFIAFNKLAVMQTP
jgi:hypothetical protein